MSVTNFDSESLKVDWISFNLEGFKDPEMLAHRLSKHFTPHVLIDDVPRIGYSGLNKKYKVSIRQYMGSKGYWVGTKIIFSGKDADYFYKLIKTQRFDWGLLKFDEHSLSLGRIDLCFSRPNDLNHISKSFGREKLKKSTRRISRALKLSNSNLTKLRGGASSLNSQLIAKQVATILVNAAKDGSIHAFAILVGCKLNTKFEKFVKIICFGGKTDALVTEIAKNLQTKRRAFLLQLIKDPQLLKHINNLLLELELIRTPLNQMDLLRLSAYGISVFEVPIVKDCILGCRGIALMYVTTKMKQILLSKMSREIAKDIFYHFLTLLASSSNGKNICGVDITEIEKLKRGMASRKLIGFREIAAPEVSVANSLLNPKFNEQIIHFIEIDPVVGKLTNSELLNNQLINYSPKFNLDYVIERLVIGNDILKLPRDHITNLW